MACCPFPYPTTVNHQHNHAPPPIYSSTTATTNWITSFFSFSSSSFKVNPHHSFPFKHNSWSGLCHATSPQPEPPPKEHLSSFAGVTATFTRFQDTLQIFFAVLFWMSLFFWSSIWDWGNGGRPNKRSRFRK